MLFISITLIVLSVGNSCLSLPEFRFFVRSFSNNSFIWLADIGNGDFRLKCVTDNEMCCSGSEGAHWRDERGRPFHQGVDGTSCLYVTIGNGVISLNRKEGCLDHTPGLWRCDIPDSSGEIQNLYVYISNNKQYGIYLLKLYTFFNIYLLKHRTAKSFS